MGREGKGGIEGGELVRVTFQVNSESQLSKYHSKMVSHKVIPIASRLGKVTWKEL